MSQHKSRKARALPSTEMLKIIEALTAHVHKNKLKAINIKETSHLLIAGDSSDLVKHLPDESVDIIITDPPYNRGLDYGKHYRDRKPKADYYKWMFSWLREVPRVLKSRGALYLISYPEINARLLPFIEDETELKFKRWLTWHYPTNITKVWGRCLTF